MADVSPEASALASFAFDAKWSSGRAHLFFRWGLSRYVSHLRANF